VTAAYAMSHAAVVGSGCMSRRCQQAIGRGTDGYQVTGIQCSAVKPLVPI